MAQLHGKQLKDSSILLDKLSGTGQIAIASGATMSFADGASLRVATVPTTDTDVTNKLYVDSVASGLDVKDAASVLMNNDTYWIVQSANTTYDNGTDGVGATLTISSEGAYNQAIDGYTFSVGDRIVWNAGSNMAYNGIYEVTALGNGTGDTVLTRTRDFDGDPSKEINGGEFVFIKSGDTYVDTGWVVTTPDTTITVGTDDILFTQFSYAGVLQAGAGLSKDANTFNVNTGTGLTISSDNVILANTDVTASSYGAADSVATFTVDAQGRLTAASDVTIDITASQVNDFDSAAETAIFADANFVDGTTIDFTVTAGDSLTAEVANGSLLTAKLDIANSGDYQAGFILGATAGGQFFWYDPTETGDITDVVAGAGLTGGGTSGSVTLSLDSSAAGAALSFDSGTLNVEVSNSDTITLGITDDAITADLEYQSSSSITLSENESGLQADLVLGTGNSSALTVEGDGLVLNETTLATNLEGDGLTANSGVLSIVAGNGIVVDTDGVSLDSDVAGNGLTYTNGVVDFVATGTNSIDFTVGADGVTASLKIGAGNDGSLTVENDGLTLNIDTLAANLEGSGLTADSGKLNVLANNGLAVNGDYVGLTDSVAGSGLDLTSGELSVVTSDFTDTLAGSGLTANGSAIDVVLDGDMLEVVGGAISLKNSIAGGDYTFTGDLRSNGDMTVDGNLTVSGTVSYLNTTELLVEDAYVTLNSGLTSGAGQNGGLEVLRGDSTAASLLWNETSDLWEIGLSGSESAIITEAGTGLSKSGNTLSIDTTGLAEDMAGAGLTAAAGVLNIVAADTNSIDITVNEDSIQADLIIQDSNSMDLTIGASGLKADLIIAGTADSSLSVVAGGLELDRDELAANLEGAGLTAASGVLSVLANNGLAVNGDYVGLTDSVAGDGLSLTAGVLDVNLGAGLTLSGDNIILASTVAGDGLNFAAGVLSIDTTDFADNLAGAGLVQNGAALDVNTTNGIDVYGDAVGLTDSVAGNGLTFNAGEINVVAGEGIFVQADSVGLTQAVAGDGLAYAAGVLSVNTTNGIDVFGDAVGLTDSVAGNGLTFNAGEINVVAGEGIFVQADSVGLTQAVAGDGLAYAAGVLSVNTTNGIDVYGDAVGLTHTVAGTGLTFSGGVLSIVGGHSQPVYQTAQLSATYEGTNGSGADTGLDLTSTPNDYSRINVYVNGQLQTLGNTTNRDCWFGTASTAKNFADLASGDSFIWNAQAAGFKLESGDEVRFIYEA